MTCAARTGLYGALGALGVIFSLIAPGHAALPVGVPWANRVLISDADARRLAVSEFHGHKVTSILNIRKRLGYGEFVWDDASAPAGRVWIRIDLTAQILSVFRGGNEIGTAVIMYGADRKPTPVGQFAVLWKKADHRSSLYDAKMPYTLRITGDGVAIHGADVKRGTATNGCIGVPIAFAQLLFRQAVVGTPVIIVRKA